MKRLISLALVGVMAAAGAAVVTGGPAGAGPPTNWPVDAQVKAKGDPFYSGIEIFGNAEPGQVRAVFALPGETALFRIKLQNTKFQNNRIRVFEEGFGGGLIRFKVGTVDVTDAILYEGGYVQKVGPRGSIVLKVKVRDDGGGGAGFRLHAESDNHSGGSDHVEAGIDI